MFSKLVRIGKDATLRFTPSNKPVIGLPCVYDIGWGDKKKSQWIDVTIWGKQAESLAPFLLKGKQIVINADDLEIEQYEHNGKSGSKLKCRAINIDLVSDGSKEESKPEQQQVAQQKPAGHAALADNNSFDDDIPF